MRAINPATEEPLKNYPEYSAQDAVKIIEKVNADFLLWKETAFSQRSHLMMNVSNVLREGKREWAEIITNEMGKPISDSKVEIEKCAWVCEYYAEHAEAFLSDEPIQSDAAKSYVSYQPLGVVLAIMPWNFPFWQVFRFAAPGLMAGNAALLKHASNVPGVADAIERVFKKAGFPDHLFKSLYIDTDTTSTVIAHPLVRAVTLTGSTRAGKAVAAKAGSVLKKCVLELGGSDPYIVMKDADLDEAVKTCVASRLINNGQSCISAKRFIVDQSIAKAFTQKMVEEMKSYSFGDPYDEGNQLGPMVGKKYREELADQVTRSIEQGARCILGGAIPNGKGYFYPPTILENVKKGMPAYDEELFGPVAAIITVGSEEEAIDVANDTLYGLGAAIFSQDIQKAEEIAATKLQAGSCFVNSLVKSDPRLPFGGIKESGFGRELSHHGIKEFMNAKTVYIK